MVLLPTFSDIVLLALTIGSSSCLSVFLFASIFLVSLVLNLDVEDDVLGERIFYL
jgi:hypothetical protein